MDLDLIEKDLANMVIDFYMEKDVKQHIVKFEAHIKVINDYVAKKVNSPDDALANHLMTIGYWYYRVKENQS